MSGYKWEIARFGDKVPWSAASDFSPVIYNHCCSLPHEIAGKPGCVNFRFIRLERAQARLGMALRKISGHAPGEITGSSSLLRLRCILR